MSNNVSYVMDDAFNYSMWVEVYNSFNSTNLNLSGYYFTDDPVNPDKWKPASQTVVAKGYATLWFEREERAGHATFKLDPEGGTLYLVNSSSAIIDSVSYPAQYRNISYGRKTDNASEWVFFEQPSPGATNNNKLWSSQRCPKPVLSLKNGFFSSSQTLKFMTPSVGDTIYYSTNGSEPTRKSNRYYAGASISIGSTTIIRAKTFSYGRLSSDVVTSTFFINQRDTHLPVVSIVTDNANLTDNTIGIYVAGTNGITGNGSTTAVNWNQDWDRPANFELFDTTGVSCLNQELDIAIAGNWTRGNPQKSLKISPRNKFGDGQLRYDIFAATKPGREYKDIQLRNSGNDFYYSMMRDAFMESLILNRMDLDYLAYEPAVLFMNGAYYGIQNLRERSSKDYLFSNYGLDEDEFHLLESWSIPYDTSYTLLSKYISTNDISKSEVYNLVCEMMDVDNFINYMISEIYFGNTDWPYNNIKIWKKKNGGKWRWILFDTDFGFSLYNNSLYNHNTLTFALGENIDGIVGYTTHPEWSILLLKRLVLNDTFRNKFIDRFSIHLSTTFETSRVNHVMDSLASKISAEIVFHKSIWPSYRTFAADLTNMKNFSANRPGKMSGYISSRFLNSAPIQTIHLSSNMAGATYLLNSEPILDSDAKIKYYKNRAIALEANPIPGYKFKQWASVSSSLLTMVPMGSNWKYFDGSAMPATNWNASSFSDELWKSGPAQLGYGDAGIQTIISYGNDANKKYASAYFRKTINIDNLNLKTDFNISAFFDDGVVVYINGHEAGRSNMPSGTITYNTFSSAYNDGAQETFSVPLNFLKEGENLIAVEVHQCNSTSSDLAFDLQFTCTTTNTSSQVFTDPVYSGTLTENLDLMAVYEKSDDEPSDENTILINEVVSGNSIIDDEFGGKDDYIELYNNGEQGVNIAGWYLTDTPVNPTLAQIPTTDATKTTIPAKGRIILWADDEPGQGVLHLGFKLGKEGETVVLSRKNFLKFITIVDSLSYPSMNTNMSYSRIFDGGPVWAVQATSFNSSNLLSQLELVPESKVNIFPTLVQESFTILNAFGYDITISDLTGKIIHHTSCLSDNETIQIGYLKKGLYIIRVGNQTTKIVKK